MIANREDIWLLRKKKQNTKENLNKSDSKKKVKKEKETSIKSFKVDLEIYISNWFGCHAIPGN